MRARLVQQVAVRHVRLEGYALPPRFALELTEDEDGGPDVTLRFRVVEKRVECEAVEFRAHEDGPELTAADLRALRLGDLMEEAVQMAARPVEERGDGTIAITVSSFKSGDRGAVRAVNRRRRRVNPETLEQVARIVRSTERPVDEIMTALGVERRAAQLWVKRAREGGYLDDQAGDETAARDENAPRLEPPSQGHTIEEMSKLLGWDKRGDGDDG